MTRTPDPANPQPGDQFHALDGRVRTVTAVGRWRALVIAEGDAWEYAAPLDVIAASYRPVLPPLITEPVTLHHAHADDQWWLTTATLEGSTLSTGRTIELRPDGTWAETT